MSKNLAKLGQSCRRWVSHDRGIHPPVKKVFSKNPYPHSACNSIQRFSSNSTVVSSWYRLRCSHCSWNQIDEHKGCSSWSRKYTYTIYDRPCSLKGCRPCRHCSPRKFYGWAFFENRDYLFGLSASWEHSRGQWSVDNKKIQECLHIKLKGVPRPTEEKQEVERKQKTEEK